MRLYLRLAWRNVWRHSRRTATIIIAMSLTLAFMLMYDGMIAGFNQAIYGNAIKVLGGNIQIHAEGYRAKSSQTPLLPLPNDQQALQIAVAQPQVIAASRRINTGGLVSSPEGAFAVGIVGIEPDQETDINLASHYVIAGRFLTSDDLDSIFIGKGLADAMGVQVGDRITLSGRTTNDQMRQRTMTVVGIFDLNMPDLEKRTVYITLQEAQDLYGLSGQSTEIAVVLEQVGQEAAVMNAIIPNLPGYEVDSFETSFPELEAAISSKSGVMSVVSVVILAISGIGILNLLLMAVYERTREIGLLGALGFRPRQISLLFILEGLLIGLVGVAVGIVFGVLINGILRQVGLDYTQFTSMTSYMALINDRIYPGWGLENLLGRSLTVAIIAILAAFIPAREAAQNDPAESLHYV